MEKNQTAGELIGDKAGYSVQWEIIMADSSVLVLRLEQQQQEEGVFPKPYF